MSENKKPETKLDAARKLELRDLDERDAFAVRGGGGASTRRRDMPIGGL